MSMRLYATINNDLLKTIHNRAACIGGIPAACPTYADDIALISLFKVTMQTLLDIAYQHSRKWKYDFNPKKSSTIVIGKDISPATVLNLGNQVLPVMTKEKHLGVPLASSSQDLEDMINERIIKARSLFYAMLGVGGLQVPVPIPVMSKLCQTNIIPYLLYGLEMVKLPESSATNLERMLRFMAKRIQGLPDHAANPTALTTLGWWSIKSQLMYRRLTTLWQMLLLSTESICKQIAIRQWIQYERHHRTSEESKSSGPVALMYDAARQLDLVPAIERYIMDADYMSKSQWKNTLEKKIRQRERMHLLAVCPLYHRLCTYQQCVKDITMWPWWTHSLKCPGDTRRAKQLLRLITGESELNRTPDGRGVVPRAVCDICDTRPELTAGHMLFGCPGLSDKREVVWTNVERLVPNGL